MTQTKAKVAPIPGNLPVFPICGLGPIFLKRTAPFYFKTELPSLYKSNDRSLFLSIIFVQVIDALLSCHHQHPLAKFWGACNEEKWALDKCFRVRTSY